MLSRREKSALLQAIALVDKEEKVGKRTSLLVQNEII